MWPATVVTCTQLITAYGDDAYAVYQVPIRNMHELWQQLVETWAEFPHSIHADGAHFEHLM